MAKRTVEDRLREEYFVLLPDARRVLEELEAEVRHCLLPLSSRLDKYERLVVTSRIKDCESALKKLRPEGGVFDPDQADSYTLTALNDLAGVRVMVFPRSRWHEADTALRCHRFFSSWKPDPVLVDDEGEEPLAFKYYGYCSRSTKFHAELQIVPMLIGLFWEVEHAAMYKPSPELKGDPESLEKLRREVYGSLRAFETEFERLVGGLPDRRSGG